MGIPDHFTCLLRNLYEGQEETVKTGQRTMDWCKTGKGESQGCILTPCLFNLYIELLLFSHSGVSDSVILWTAACQASLSFTISQSLLKLMSIESVMPPNHLILCRPLLFLPSVFPSIRVFSNESPLIRWPKYLELQFQDYSFHWIFRVDFL